MQFVSFAVLGKRIKSIKALLKDPNVPKRKKFLVIFGIIYLLMPIDLIPAPVLIFGFIDDIVPRQEQRAYLANILAIHAETVSA